MIRLWSENFVFCFSKKACSPTQHGEHSVVVPILCPGDRSDGVWAGLSPGQGGLTTGQLSLVDLQVHPQASSQVCSFSLLSVSSSS